MNVSVPLVNVRSYLSDQFSRLRMHALRDSLGARLIGKSTRLAVFPEQAPHKSPNRRFIGMAEIPIQQIIGTLNRQSDFDRKFRPLKSYLRDRWVNVYLSLEKDGWPAIVVHKVGDNYYVEDGHHRVSIARLIGLTSIAANVWEYPICIERTRKHQPDRCLERSSVKVYAAQ